MVSGTEYKVEDVEELECIGDVYAVMCIMYHKLYSLLVFLQSN